MHQELGFANICPERGRNVMVFKKIVFSYFNNSSEKLIYSLQTKQQNSTQQPIQLGITGLIKKTDCV